MCRRSARGLRTRTSLEGAVWTGPCVQDRQTWRGRVLHREVACVLGSRCAGGLTPGARLGPSGWILEQDGRCPGARRLSARCLDSRSEGPGSPRPSPSDEAETDAHVQTWGAEPPDQQGWDSSCGPWCLIETPQAGVGLGAWSQRRGCIFAEHRNHSSARRSVVSPSAASSTPAQLEAEKTPKKKSHFLSLSHDSIFKQTNFVSLKATLHLSNI